MALNVANFATIARAEKSLHVYITTDAYATVVTADYFANKDIISSLGVGDFILVTASNGAFLLNVTKVVKAIGSTYEVDTVAAKCGSLPT